MQRHLLVGLVVVVGACLVGWTARTQSQAQVTWEYREVELDARIDATQRLNQLGTQGWELVGVTSGCASSPSTTLGCRYWAYLKRAR